MNKFFAWQQIPSTIVTEILSLSHDGVVLDTEHSFWNYESIQSSIQVGKLAKVKVFVRIHKKDTGIISKILDSGADGIILSTVESIEEAKILKDCALHPSQSGKRGLGLVRQNNWGQKGLKPELPILIPQIETKTGIKNIKEISSLDFDFYLIGPYDLSSSLGCPGDFENHDFIENIAKFKNEIPEEKRAVHIPSNVEDQIYKYSSFGMICLGMDTMSLIDTSDKNVRIAKRNLSVYSHKESISKSS